MRGDPPCTKVLAALDRLPAHARRPCLTEEEDFVERGAEALLKLCGEGRGWERVVAN